MTEPRDPHPDQVSTDEVGPHGVADPEHIGRPHDTAVPTSWNLQLGDVAAPIKSKSAEGVLHPAGITTVGTGIGKALLGDVQIGQPVLQHSANYIRTFLREAGPMVFTKDFRSAGVREFYADLAASGAMAKLVPDSRPAQPMFAVRATYLVVAANTPKQFGAAVQALYTGAGFSLNQLAAKVRHLNNTGKAHITGLSKAALSDVGQGKRRFQTVDSVRYLLILCGAEADYDVWAAAWRRVKTEPTEPHIPRDTTAAPTDTETADPVEEVRGAGEEPKLASWWDGPDDEVLVHVPVTRQQVRAAVLTLVIVGVGAAGVDSPTVRAAGLAMLGVAAGIALVNHNRQVSPAPA